MMSDKVRKEILKCAKILGKLERTIFEETFPNEPDPLLLGVVYGIRVLLDKIGEY